MQTLTDHEKFIIWLAHDKLGLEFIRKNNRNEYVMRDQEGIREPYTKEALRADIFPLN